MIDFLVKFLFFLGFNLAVIVPLYYLLARYMAHQSANHAFKAGYIAGYNDCLQKFAEDLAYNYELDLNAPENRHIKELLEEKK